MAKKPKSEKNTSAPDKDKAIAEDFASSLESSTADTSNEKKDAAKAPPLVRPAVSAPQKAVLFDQPTRLPIMWVSLILAGMLGAGLAIAGMYLVLRNTSFGMNDDMPAQMRAMAERVAQVEGQRSKLMALENTGNRMEQRLNTVETTRNALNSLQEKVESDINRLETAMREGRSGIDNADLSAIEQRLAMLEQKTREMTSSTFAEKERLTSLALASLALREALDKGVPYAEELGFVRNLLHGSSNLGMLEQRADKGLPTTSALLANFPAAARAMLHADESHDGSTLGALKSWIWGLFSIRRIGEVEGTSVDAVLARIEQRLKQDNSEDAHALFVALPEPLQHAAGSWGGDLAAKAAGDRLMRGIMLNVAQGLQPQGLQPRDLQAPQPSPQPAP